MNKMYIIRLTAEERARLEEIVGKGKAAAYRLRDSYERAERSDVRVTPSVDLPMSRAEVLDTGRLGNRGRGRQGLH